MFMSRSILCFLLMLGACAGCKDKTENKTREATITQVDPNKRTVNVKTRTDGKDVEHTFKLAENIEYMDSTGRVAAADIFTSGDTVLIVEREGTITKMKRKDHAETAIKSDNKDKADKEARTEVAKRPDSNDKTDKEARTEVAKRPDSNDKADKEAPIANQKFIQAADQIDLAEMKLGKVAEKHAASGMVKKFGERTVRDHTLMNKELREITSKKGIKLADGLDQTHQELIEELSKLKGAEFDRAYTKDMVSGHEKAIEQFEKEAKNGRDPDVKAWAEKWLPTLREHLTLARDAVKDVKAK